MSRDASRTTAKSKLELSATIDNGETLTVVTDSAAVLETPPYVLKNICLKLLHKLNEIIKLHMHYLYTAILYTDLYTDFSHLSIKEISGC